MKIDVKLFNPLYWHLLDALHDDNVFLILVTGGSSAAKTYSITQALCFGAMEKQLNTMILRKEGTSIQDTVYSDFKNIGSRINKALARDIFEFYVNRVACGLTKFRFRGLDDSEKVKGLSDYLYVWLNEISSFEQGEFSEIRRRLRGRPGLKLISDWNPISEDHWLKTDLIDNEDWVNMPLTCKCPKGAMSELDPVYSKKWKTADGKIVFIKTTYRDNYWIVGHPDGKHGFRDENALYNFEKMKEREPAKYQVYGLGEWGHLNTGGEFYKKFNSDKNIKNVEYRPDLPLHISFDFNVNPAMHATIWQAEGKTVWLLNEIATKDPYNTTSGACKEVERYYLAHKAGMFIYGDPSGKHRDTRRESASNDYKIIEKALKRFHPLFRVANKQPSVNMRGNFINSIFEYNCEGITIFINPNCPKIINDLMYGKQEADGSKMKEKTRDPITKISYEKYHHLSDSMDYFICEAYKKEYDRYQGTPTWIDRARIIKRRHLL